MVDIVVQDAYSSEMDGRCILITGAARIGGIGHATARLLIAHGARVVIGDLDNILDPALATELGSACVLVPLDVRRAQDWHGALKLAVAHGGGLHGLVNNAAIYRPASLGETTEESFRAHCDVNQLGSFLGMKLAAPLMARTGGAIVNVSSSAGLKGSRGSFAYSASKWALRGMTKSAALEMADQSIRVNSIHPGPVATGMIAFRSKSQRQVRIEQVPLGREGQSEDVAEAIAFLLSSRSRWITGAEIAIDGGVVL